MPDTETLAARVRALERRATGHDAAADGADTDADALLATSGPDTGALEARLDDVEARLDRLDADLQAVRGFAGELDTVNDAVERRADAALAAVDRLEADADPVPNGGPGPARTPRGSPDDTPQNRSDDAAQTGSEDALEPGRDALERSGFDRGAFDRDAAESRASEPGLLARLRAHL